MEAYIFDLDGVLVDTAKFHYLAWKSVADSLGLYFDENINEKLKGVSRKRSLEIILEFNKVDFSDFNLENILIEKNEIYLGYINDIDDSELLPGAKKLLLECKERSIHVCLGSASKNAKLILENTRIIDLFDYIVDGNDVTKAKPDPEVFIKSSDYLGIKSEFCTVFEDSQAGIDAAIRAGMNVVGIGSDSILHGTDIIIKNLSEFKFK